MAEEPAAAAAALALVLVLAVLGDSRGYSGYGFGATLYGYTPSSSSSSSSPPLRTTNPASGALVHSRPSPPRVAVGCVGVMGTAGVRDSARVGGGGGGGGGGLSDGFPNGRNETPDGE